MKKGLLLVILSLALAFFAASCSKNEVTPPTPPPNNSPDGRWLGTYIFAGNPSRYFQLYLNAGGTLVINADSQNAPTVGDGNWSLGGDSVRASFNFMTGSILGPLSFAGKYSTSSIKMDGTLGYGTNTAGAGTFSVTKQ